MICAGQVLMLTTPEDPYIVLSKLRTRTSRVQGILHGYYRVTGDQVSCHTSSDPYFFYFHKVRCYTN